MTDRSEVRSDRSGARSELHEARIDGLAALVSYLAYQLLEGEKMYGARWTREAVRGLLAVTGLTASQFWEVAGVDKEDRVDV